MSILWVGVWTLASLLAGSLLLHLLRHPHGAADPNLALFAGLLVLHLLLTALDLSPLPWSRGSVLVPFLLAAVLGASLAGRPYVRQLVPLRLGWGDAVAGGCLLLICIFALQGRLANPDYIFHWGIKGEKFFLAGGTDYLFLSRPWNYFRHPDYPNLVPELFAVTAIGEGRFDDAAAFLWSVLANLVLLLAARRLLERLAASPFVRQAALATLALAVTSLTVSWRLIGNADAWMAAAFLSGASSVLGRRSRANDLTVGITAAFAAAVKIEGVPFAGFLVALYLLGSERPRFRLAVLARTTLPPLLVIAPWVARVWHHDLAQGYYTGSFAAERLRIVFWNMLDISLHDGWHGISLLCLALLPLLLLSPRSRGVAALMLVQLAFYVFVYLTRTADTELLVRWSFPRLMLHLVPVILVFAARSLDDPTDPAANATGC